MKSPKKTFSRSRIAAGIILLMMLAGIGLYELAGRPQTVAEPLLPPLVRVMEAGKISEVETKSFPGIAKESQSVNLSFRVPGKLIELNVPIGKRITKDTVVARLDPRDYELTVQRFEAEYVSALAMLKAMKTGARPEDTATLESQLAAAMTAFETAGTNLNRLTSLLADEVATQAQFDLAKTQFDAAKGQKESLENELKKAKTGSRQEEIESTEAKIVSLETQLAVARNALSDTQLKAPFEGIVVEKFIEDHENVSPGMSIVSFFDVSHIDVSVSIPEEMIIRLDDIRTYSVEFESYPGKLYPAALKEIGLAVQHGRQTYPLQVHADLPPDAKVFPGMTAMVRIELRRSSQVQSIPLTALIGNGEETAVWVIKNDTTHRRPVKVLGMIGSNAEIEGGLEPHEKIVVAGTRSLREGQTVRVSLDGIQ